MRVGLAQVDDDRAPLEPLHRAGDQVAALVLELVEEAVPLGLADLLDDHLLGRLGGDPAQLRGVHLDPVLGGVDVPGLAIDVDLDLGGIRVVLPGRRGQRRLDPVEQDILGDILVAVNAVHDPDQINAHSIPPRRAHRLLSMVPEPTAAQTGADNPKTTPSRARSSRRGSVFLPRCHRAEQRLPGPSPARPPHGPIVAQGTNQAPNEPSPNRRSLAAPAQVLNLSSS